jgi:hypothetical protein
MHAGSGGGITAEFVSGVAIDEGIVTFHPSCMSSPARGMGGRFANMDHRATSNHVMDLGVDVNCRNEAPSISDESCRNQQRWELVECSTGEHRRVNTCDKVRIPTDDSGDVVGLRIVFQNAIRDIVGRVLDVNVVNFQDHPRVAMDIINQDLQRQFYIDPPLRPRYVREYLMNSLCTSRYRWRKHWKKTGTQHPHCLERRYPALVVY